MMLQRKIDFTLELPLIKFERAHPPYMGCINYDFVRATSAMAPKIGPNFRFEGPVFLSSTLAITLDLGCSNALKQR